MKWSVEELLALHIEWLRTLDDSLDSGPFSQQSNGAFYVSQFLEWLNQQQPDKT